MQIREVLDNDTNTVFRIVWVAIHFQLGASLYFFEGKEKLIHFFCRLIIFLSLGTSVHNFIIRTWTVCGYNDYIVLHVAWYV